MVFSDAVNVFLDAKFLAGMLSNSIALYLAFTKSRKQLSEYKKLLILFLISDIIFSTVQELLKPVGMIDGNMFLVYMEEERQSKLSLSLYCGMVSMSFLIFAFHFIYRAYSISAMAKVVLKLDFAKLSFIVISLIVDCIIWAYICQVYLSYEPSYFLRLKRFFDSQNNDLPEDLEGSFLIFVSYRDDGSIRWDKFAVIMLLFGIIGIEVIIVAASSIHIMRTLRKRKTLSDASMKMHDQLFKALLVQVAIPTVLMYMPCSFYFVTPFLLPDTVSTPPGLITTMYSWFPIVDPLANILMIAEYRNAIIKWLRILRILPNAVTTTNVETITIEPLK